MSPNRKNDADDIQDLKRRLADALASLAMESAARKRAELALLESEGRFKVITELKHGEDEIRHLNRTLIALSNSNHAMLHAANESQFLDEVCHIIIHDCDFAMVWIGYVQDDERQSVKPVASAGFDQGYLDALNISMTDPQRSSGPTGIAIRTGQPARCNNMLTDPCFAPWRQAALDNGYASSIVLPLLTNGHAFGALNIYSPMPDGFSDEEEMLLLGLAGDLAYGITSFRQKENSARAAEKLRLSEERYRTLFDNMTEGFALHEIVCDAQGKPTDYRFLEVNPSFESMTGFRHDKVIGQLASEVLPGLEPFWIETYGKVTLTGEPVQFDHYTATLDRYYHVYAYRPAPGQFAVIFMDITQARQAELQLSAIAEKYATLFDTTSDGIWIHNGNGEILEVNDAYCQMSGYTRDELTHMSIQALEACESPNEITEHMRDMLEYTGNNHFESLHRRKDGSTFDVDITALKFDKVQGRIAIFARDISARKRVEERLAYLASFPERNPHPVVEVDPSGKITYANYAAMQLFPDLWGEGTVYPWIADLAASFDQFHNSEATVITRDVVVGQRWYQQSLSYIGSKDLIRIYAIDITNRYQVEEALRQSEDRYRSIVETASEGIVLSKPTGEFIYVNQQMANMLGYSVEEILGKSATDFMFGAQQSLVQELRDELHQGDVLQGEFKFCRKDGTLLWSMYNATPVFNEGGKHISNLALHTDITQRKQAENALQQAHADLERRVQERTQELNIANTQLRAEAVEREKAQTELESSLLELQVIEEELRNNNDMLIDAQKVLDDQRKSYQDLFEFAPDAYLVTDKNGRILDANQFVTQLLNIPRKTIIGKPLIVYIAEKDHPSFNNLISTLYHKQTIQSQELRFVPRHGAEIITSVKVAFAKDQGDNDTLRWTIRDITARIRAEEIIQRNALRDAVLAEVSQSLTGASLEEKAILDIVATTTARMVGDSCIITLVSGDGQWLEPVAVKHKKAEVLEFMNSLNGYSHNPITVGLFGRVFQAAKPLLIKSLSPTDALASVPSLYHQYLDQVGISSMLIVPIPVGEKIIGTLGIMRDRDGQPYTEDDQSLLEILASRTGQTIHNARLYQELQAALHKEVETHDQLVQAEKFAAVGRLLASITHEINNPLQTIKNCLYLSQLDTLPGTQASDAIAIATSETNRLSNLVAQLREIYRPPTKGLNRQVDLLKLVAEVETLLGSYLQDKHVKWVVTPPEAEQFSHLVVDGVPDQLKQVFLNLGLNAIDAMEPAGGSIMIDFQVAAAGDAVGISFRDTGPGLPAEVKSKLFEPFTTTKEKGLGLGLVICYDIIKRHNGHIDVENEPGKGVAFTIWLPARSEHGEKI